MKIKADYVNEPQWKILTVKATLPKELKCLDEMAHNMWWVWNHEARDLFRDIDVDLYHESREARHQSSLGGLLLYGVWHPLSPEDLFRRSGYAGR